MLRHVALSLLVLASPPLLAAIAAPASLDFGGQSMGTASPAQRVTFTNNGASPITVTGVTVPAQFAQANTCGALAAGASCAIDVTFRPANAAAALNASLPVTGTLAVATSAGTTSVPLAGAAEKSLVTHFYRAILRRAPDAGGKAFWASEAARMQALGANVNETWYAMAATFYSSAEYLAFNRDATGFVTDLYNTFFNRAPDAGGLSFWVGQIGSGMPREVVLVSFIFSQEFGGFVQGLFGTAAVRAELDVVGDFYRGLLARLPDDAGFNAWVGQFRTAQCQSAAAVSAQAAAISASFANGAEYAARQRNNAQYVGDLYNAFLRRGGDLAGVQYWIGQIGSGARSRDQVRGDFVASAEFTARVNAVVAQGCLPPVPPPTLDCASATVLCVGAGREFTSIQTAVNAAVAGNTVLVFDGSYPGFRVSLKNGTPSSRITVKAAGANAVISTPHSGGQGIEINNSNHVTIEGFRMDAMPDYGIRVGGASPASPMQGIHIRNNTVTNSQVVNIYASNVANSLIEGNSTSGSKTSHGIYLANGGSDDTVVRGNRSFNNAKNGLHLNGDLSIGGDGLHQRITIEGNTFFNNTANAMDLDGMVDSTVRNNLLYNNGRHGVRVFRLDAAAGAGNLRIYNNTILVADGSNAVKLTEDAGGHVIFNNVLLGGSGGIVVGHPNVRSAANVTTAGGFSTDGGTTVMSLAAWKGVAGDTSSVSALPADVFVDVGALDFRLRSPTGVASNKGLPSFLGATAPATDIAGSGRPAGGAVDIGAYESF